MSHWPELISGGACIAGLLALLPYLIADEVRWRRRLRDLDRQDQP